MLLSSSFGKSLAKFGLAAVISPVSVADKAKGDEFYHLPVLDLTYDLLRFLKCLK